jgi:hypothetical protein
MAWSDPPRLLDGEGHESTLLHAYARGTRVARSGAARARRSSATSWLGALVVGSAMACLVAGRFAASIHAAPAAFARGAGGAEGTSGGARAAAGAGPID